MMSTLSQGKDKELDVFGTTRDIQQVTRDGDHHDAFPTRLAVQVRSIATTQAPVSDACNACDVWSEHDSTPLEQHTWVCKRLWYRTRASKLTRFNIVLNCSTHTWDSKLGVLGSVREPIPACFSAVAVQVVTHIS